MQNSNQDSHATLIKGSAWMTFGSIVSRILGAIYIIPWYAWLGSHGNVANALTAQSYNIYSLFLIISTAGIPGAIAKQVAKYNALNEYGVGRKLFQRGLILMGLFGVLSAAVMYFSAPLLSGGDPRQVPVLRALSCAVLIIPVLSIMRGFFQGYSDMMPSALSQLIEQLARVIWMLLTAFVIMKVQHGSYLHAVTQSNFAAAIGALFGILLLVFFYWQRRSTFKTLFANSSHDITVSTSSLLQEIIQQSIPFIIIDSGITLFQLLDQYTFHPIMAMFVHVPFDTIESWYALFGLNANKLVMIIVSLATAMAVTAIPLLSGAKAHHDHEDIASQIENTLELFLFVMIPASLGMAAIATPAYTIFYGYDPLGSRVLYLSAFTAITLGLFTVAMAILQGLSENMLAIKYLILGLAIKAVVQLPLIWLARIYGPLLATNLGLLVTVWMAIKHLSVTYHFNLSRLKRRFVGIGGFSIGVYVLAQLVVLLGGKILSPQRRGSAFLLIVIAVIVAASFYVIVALKTELAQKILGEKVTRLADKLHLNI